MTQKELSVASLSSPHSLFAKGESKHTFNQLSEIMKVDKQALVDSFFQISKVEIENGIDYFSSIGNDPEYKGVLESARNDGSYWSYVLAHEEYHKDKTIQKIIDFRLHDFHANYHYLLDLGKKLPYPLDLDIDYENLPHLLAQIPLAFRYELDFNAFIHPGPESSPIPFIGVNFVLLKTIDVFTVQVASLLLEVTRPGVFKLRSDSDILAMSKNNEHVVSIASCIDMIMGKSPYIVKVGIDSSLDGRLFYSTVPPAINFSLLHEYGHLMLGHLNLPRHKDMEYAADLFATFYINTFNQGKLREGKYSVFLGLSSFFILLLCSEIMNRNQDPYYPNVEDRIFNVFQSLSLEDKTLFVFMWNRIVYAIDHTLFEFFKLDFPMLLVKKNLRNTV